MVNRKKSKRLASKKKNENATEGLKKSSALLSTEHNDKKIASKSRNGKKNGNRQENSENNVADVVVVSDDEKSQKRREEVKSKEESKPPASPDNNNDNNDEKVQPTPAADEETNKQTDGARSNKSVEDIVCLPESTISDFIKEHKETVVNHDQETDVAEEEEEEKEDSTLSGALRGAFNALGYHDKPYYTKLGKYVPNDQLSGNCMVQANGNMKHTYAPNTSSYHHQQQPQMFVAPPPVAARPPYQVHPSYLPRHPHHHMQQQHRAHYYPPLPPRAPYNSQYYPQFRPNPSHPGPSTSHNGATPHRAYHPYANYQQHRVMGMQVPHRFVGYPQQQRPPQVRNPYTGNAAV